MHEVFNIKTIYKPVILQAEIIHLIAIEFFIFQSEPYDPLVGNEILGQGI